MAFTIPSAEDMQIAALRALASISHDFEVTPDGIVRGTIYFAPSTSSPEMTNLK
jgi:hypothetical protein